METLFNCPICNSKTFAPYIKCVDFTVSRETFSIQKCLKCGFIFTNPRPSATEMGKYYESEEYISHSNAKKGAFNTVYQLVRKYAISKKLKLIESYSPSQKILLDIGCGTGEFLNFARNKGWSVSGLEPGENARSYGINQYGLNIEDLSAFYKIPGKSFDAITMWHVLEHVPDLREFVLHLKEILKDDGVLVIAVPNCEAHEQNIYKEYWAAYDVPRHLNHFSKRTLSNLLITVNLFIKNLHPMKFDSFYISMLSEKYKGSGFIKMVVNGLLNGLKSNRAATKEITKASSLIYVIKKSIV